MTFATTKEHFLFAGSQNSNAAFDVLRITERGPLP